jgi:hypothetical protein
MFALKIIASTKKEGPTNIVKRERGRQKGNFSNKVRKIKTNSHVYVWSTKNQTFN